jgi:hypothetical protein
MSQAKFARQAEQRMERDRPATGIFGPEAFKWRGSIVRLDSETESFHARLREIRGDTAELEVLDPANLKAVVGQRVVDWPPDARVTVIRNF